MGRYDMGSEFEASMESLTPYLPYAYENRKHREGPGGGWDYSGYVTDAYEGDPLTDLNVVSYLYPSPGDDTIALGQAIYGNDEQWDDAYFEAMSQDTDLAQAQRVTIQNILSSYVIDPMGYTRQSGEFTVGDETFNIDRGYSWGDLASIYNSTPIETVAKEVQRLERSGQTQRADIMRTLYSQERPEWGANDFAAIRNQEKRFATGQIDVGMDPQMVSAMLTRRERERSQRRYKGGTVVTQGLLGTPLEQYKRYLGG